MGDIVAGEIDATPVCPTCSRPLTNGHRYPRVDPIPIGARVEVSSPKTPLIVGARIGKLLGYHEDGRLEVRLDGGDKVLLAADVVHQLGGKEP